MPKIFSMHGREQREARAADRQARSRLARAEAGGKQVAVFLSPAAAKKLDQWTAQGDSATDTISGLLERSRPARSRRKASI